jgi:hypothetical protein
MNKLVLKISALVALLSFSACNISQPVQPHHSEVVAASTIIQSQFDGYVKPTDYRDCVILVGAQRDPPLPKNVPNATWYSGGTPPIKYQKDVKVTMYFDQPNIINRTLYKGHAVCGSSLFAYTDTQNKVMHLPNPCTYPQTDPYARLACHEMGHANGWPGYHGDK